MYQEITLESLEVLFGAGRASRDHFGVNAWFRGHADSEWLLRPKVARPEITNQSQRLEFEDAMARKFMRRARTRHAKVPRDDEFPAWLFLMQHYGLPTRLLDWSESLLIAAYFAVCDHRKWDRPGVIWALNPLVLNKSIVGSEVTLTPHDPVGRLAANLPFMRDEYDKMQVEYRTTAEQLARGIVAVEPDEVDLRMLMQQSMFTIHGSMIGDESKAFPQASLIKYIIPDGMKENFAQALACAGVRRSTVFPDLDNLATELRDDSFLSSKSAAEQADGADGPSDSC